MRNFHTIEEITSTFYSQYGQNSSPLSQWTHQKCCAGFLKLDKGVVFIYTGILCCRICWNRWPFGGVLFSRAFEKLGYTPVIITDSFVRTIFLTSRPPTFPFLGWVMKRAIWFWTPTNPLHTSLLNVADKTVKDATSILAESISKSLRTVDELFKKGNKTAPSFGIGDGGNEVGMGSFADVLKNKELFLRLLRHRLRLPDDRFGLKLGWLWFHRRAWKIFTCKRSSTFWRSRKIPRIHCFKRFRSMALNRSLSCPSMVSGG